MPEVNQEPTASPEISDAKPVSKPKKTIKRTRKTVSKKIKKPASESTAISEVIQEPSTAPAPMPASESSKRISRELNAIYQDPDGTLPNMKNIDVKKTRPVLNFLVGLLVLGVAIAGIIWAKVLWWDANTLPSDALTFNISGPSAVQTGATTTYTISYVNNEDASLSNVVLDVYTPAGFVYLDSSVAASNVGNNEWKIGNIAARGHGEIVITGKLFGNLNTASSWRAFIHYQPAKFNSVLEQVATLTTKLEAGEAKVSINGPSQTSVSTPVTYTFKIFGFENATGSLSLTPHWPQNFSVTSSTPPLINGAWPIAFASANPAANANATSSSSVYKATGVFTAENDPTVSTTPISASLNTTLSGKNAASYEIANAEFNASAVSNKLSINLAINGATTDFDTKPGEMLVISLQIKNNSDYEAKNAVVKLVLDAPALKKQSMLDWANIADTLDGTIIGEQISDSLRRGTLTWTNKQLPALAKLKPGAEITIDLKIPVKKADKFDFTTAATSTLIASASLGYTDSTGAAQSLNSAPINITCNSDLAFEMRSDISKTTDNKKLYNLTWVLTNNAHALKNISISASLFGDITYKQTASSTIGTVLYDNKNKILTWQIQTLPTSVDVASFPFNITLNKENPSQSALVSKPHIIAEDSVTGKKLDFLSDELSLITTVDQTVTAPQ